ncbi:MAG: type I phosphodiesterase/nucleotide pyrophosphatase [bacterium]|nr:MAG: type I phosphodiesterase/nucleotide pyrophosphatase [bacterium]
MTRILFSILALALVVGAPACSTRSKAPRVYVIGLDGATFDLLTPWLDAGELPNLKKLMDSGVHGELQSVNPIISPVAWTSATTGVNPGKHGIYGFERPDPAEPGAQLLNTSEQRKALPIWSLLQDAGFSTAVLNVPMTWPPDPMTSGIMVSGFPFPANQQGIVYTTPPGLAASLGEYPLDQMGEGLVTGAEGDMLARIVMARDAVVRVFNAWKVGRKDDFTWAVVTATDRVQHFFWGMMDEKHPYWTPERGREFGSAIHEFWLGMDKRLGEMLAGLPEDAIVMVISDHGFAPIYREMNMYNWFVGTGLDEYVKDHQVADVYITNGIFNYRLGTTFPRSPSYDEFRSRFAKEAVAYMDPATGQAPVERVAKRESMFSGPHIGKAPDLVMVESPNYYIGAGDPSKQLEPVSDLHSTSYSAYHRPNGIVIVSGPNIRKGELAGASLLDVTPTLLHLMGQPVPSEMDGRVLTAIFDPAWLSKHAPHYKDGLSILSDRPERALSDAEREQLQGVPYIR